MEILDPMRLAAACSTLLFEVIIALRENGSMRSRAKVSRIVIAIGEMAPQISSELALLNVGSVGYFRHR